MRFVKACFILTLLLAFGNFSRAADPSAAGSEKPAIQSTSNSSPDAAAKPAVTTTQAPGTESEAERLHQRRLLTGLIVALLAGAVVYQFWRKRKAAGSQTFS